MAEQSKDILSEYTKDITPEQRAELQEKVSNMTEGGKGSKRLCEHIQE